MTPTLRNHIAALMSAIDRLEGCRNPVIHAVVASHCARVGTQIREQAAREGLLEGKPRGSLADADWRDTRRGGR